MEILSDMIPRRQLHLLIEFVILEGFKDDQRYLVEKYPDHTQDLEGLQPKWISWLTARFGERPKTEETHPFEDAIVTIVNFSKRDAAIGEKYKTNEQFKVSVDESFPPKSRSWNSPADTTTMTVDEMELILGLSERKKQRFKVDDSADIEGDRIGKIGPWNLWMPTTRENSCRIAGYDPVTRAPKTQWCTARTAGSNLFYNYTGRYNTDITLFYIIRDDPKQDQDWLSVGFENGKPTLAGHRGGVSVNRINTGLTPKSLEAVLGQYYDEIMRVLAEKNKSLGGKHPARQKIKDASQSLAAFGYLTQGLSKEETTDLKVQVLEQPEIKLEVLQHLFAHDKNIEVRRAVARNPSTPVEILQLLTRDKSYGVRSAVAHNKSASAQILQTLSHDKDLNVRKLVANNPSTPDKVLQIFTQDESVDVKGIVAINRSASIETLQLLAQDVSKNIRWSVARNPSASIETLQLLAQDVTEDVRKAAMSQLRFRGLNEVQLRQLIRQML